MTETDVETKTRDYRKRNRILYIIEAALEYFASIAVSGAYLACLTTAIGISDALTGVLTSFVSLGCGFQILAVLLRGNIKRKVTILHLVNETAFTLLYVTPFFPVSSTTKTVIFTALMLIGFALNNVANPPKTDRFMQSVDKDKRGVFTANKEIASLISGMAFSLLLGYVIDGFKAAGNDRGAFAACGAVLGIITILHAVTIISSKDLPGQSKAQTEEKPQETAEISEETKNAPERGGLRAALKDKNLMKVVGTIALWRIVQYSTVPFYGTYQIKELVVFHRERRFALKQKIEFDRVVYVRRVALGRLYRAVVLDVISRFERARRRQTDGYRRYGFAFFVHNFTLSVIADRRRFSFSGVPTNDENDD